MLDTVPTIMIRPIKMGTLFTDYLGRIRMQIYSVMLEGMDASMGFFVNVEVAALNASSAAKLAEEHTRELGLNIIGIEEITRTGRSSSSEPKVLSISGKSYFPIGH